MVLWGVGASESALRFTENGNLTDLLGSRFFLPIRFWLAKLKASVRILHALGVLDVRFWFDI